MNRGSKSDTKGCSRENHKVVQGSPSSIPFKVPDSSREASLGLKHTTTTVNTMTRHQRSKPRPRPVWMCFLQLTFLTSHKNPRPFDPRGSIRMLAPSWIREVEEICFTYPYLSHITYHRVPVLVQISQPLLVGEPTLGPVPRSVERPRGVLMASNGHVTQRTPPVVVRTRTSSTNSPCHENGQMPRLLGWSGNETGSHGQSRSTRAQKGRRKPQRAVSLARHAASPQILPAVQGHTRQIFSCRHRSCSMAQVLYDLGPVRSQTTSMPKRYKENAGGKSCANLCKGAGLDYLQRLSCPFLACFRYHYMLP